MNFADFSRLVWRRWYVFVAGLLVAVSIIATLRDGTTVYIAVAEVEFDPPAFASATSRNATRADILEATYDSRIAFTGTVERAYNARHPSTELSTSTATFFGNGVREGLSVAASRSGGQWQSRQNRPVIIVTASAPSESQALSMLNEALTRLDSITAQLQADSGVAPPQRIRALWNDREFAIDTYGPTRTSIFKGASVLGTATLVASGLLASGMDRIAVARTRRRTGSPLLHTVNPRKKSRR